MDFHTIPDTISVATPPFPCCCLCLTSSERLTYYPATRTVIYTGPVRCLFSGIPRWSNAGFSSRLIEMYRYYPKRKVAWNTRRSVLANVSRLERIEDARYSVKGFPRALPTCLSRRAKTRIQPNSRPVRYFLLKLHFVIWDFSKNWVIVKLESCPFLKRFAPAFYQLRNGTPFVFRRMPRPQS